MAQTEPAGFTVFPAIDLRRGQVVRLRQGDPAAQTTFGDDPAAAARAWAEQGACWLHVVNLDGAFAGDAHARPRGAAQAAAAPRDVDPHPALPINLRRLAEIRAAAALPIQFGGGMRSLEAVAQALALGAARVVLGTAAVQQPEVVAQAVARFGPERIVVGIDARGGRVATHGWQETSDLDALAVALRMRDLGVARIIYTDVSRDGMLSGVNVAATAALARESGLKVIASGGVAGPGDIAALVACAPVGVEGVIIGQALYTGVLRLADALALVRGS